MEIDFLTSIITFGKILSNSFFNTLDLFFVINLLPYRCIYAIFIKNLECALPYWYFILSVFLGVEIFLLAYAR